MVQGDETDRTRMDAMREDYSLAGLAEEDLAADWVTQFDRWLHDAVVARLPEPNAMVLATASPVGEVASRSVLCKGVDEAGVVFYTNLGSDKSRDLMANRGRRRPSRGSGCSARCTCAVPWSGSRRS